MQPGQPQLAPAPGAQQQQPQQAAPDQAEYEWRRVIFRMIEDCADNVDPQASADRIVGLTERFPQFSPYVDQLIGQPAETVLDLCASIMPAEVAPRVQAMKSMQAPIEWIDELKELVPQVRAERQQPDPDNRDPEEA